MKSKQIAPRGLAPAPMGNWSFPIRHSKFPLLTLLALTSSLELPAQTAAWTEITHPSSPAFAHHDMTYDSARHRLIVAGRTSIMQNPFAIYAGAADGSWTQLPSPSPALPGQEDIELAYDSHRDRVVLYTTATNKVWEFDGTNWHVITAATTPIQCADGAQMQYDPVRHKTVLVGCAGFPDSDSPSETWLWDGTDWTLAAGTNASPRGAAGGGMAFDSARGEMVLVTHSTMQTWIFNGTNWTQRAPATTPAPGVWVFDMAFHPPSGLVVLYGGEHLDALEPWNSSYPTDTWAWDGTDWRKLAPPTTPPATIDYAFAYFPERDGLVLHGGWGPAGDWEFRTNVWLLTIQSEALPELLVAAAVSPGGLNMPERTNNGVLLYRYNGTARGALQLVATILPTPQNHLYDPVGVAFAPWGELFVGNRHGNQQFNPGSGSIARFLVDAAGQVTPNGVITGNGLWAVHDLAFSPAGELFAANFFSDTISRFTFDAQRNAIPHGAIQTPQGSFLEGLAFSPSGELFASAYTVITRYRFDAQGNAVPNGTIANPGVGRLHFPRFNAAGELFAPSLDDSRIYRFLFDEAGNAVPHGYFPASAPLGQVFSPSGELFVTTHTEPPLYNVGSITRFTFDAIGDAVPNGTIPSNPANDPIGGIAMRLLDFPPTLSVARAANNTVVVSWPAPAQGWVLEATNALPNVAAPWPVIPPPYQTNGANLQFIEPTPASNKFYRLHKP